MPTQERDFIFSVATSLGSVMVDFEDVAWDEAAKPRITPQSEYAFDTFADWLHASARSARGIGLDLEHEFTPQSFHEALTCAMTVGGTDVTGFELLGEVPEVDLQGDDAVFESSTGVETGKLLQAKDFWSLSEAFLTILGPVSGPKAHDLAKIEATDREKEALENYSGSLYKTVNLSLRKGVKIPKEDAQDLKQLDIVFSKASTKDMIEVYRGVDGPFFSDLSPGSIFHDGGFVSTTTDKKAAKNFLRGDSVALLKIIVPKGTQAISVRDIAQFGKSEQEIVLNRGLNFKVLSVREKTRTIPKTITVQVEVK